MFAEVIADETSADEYGEMRGSLVITVGLYESARGPRTVIVPLRSIGAGLYGYGMADVALPYDVTMSVTPDVGRLTVRSSRSWGEVQFHPEGEWWAYRDGRRYLGRAATIEAAALMVAGAE